MHWGAASFIQMLARQLQLSGTATNNLFVPLQRIAPPPCISAPEQTPSLPRRRRRVQRWRCSAAAVEAAQQQAAAPEGELDGMSEFLDSLKWDADGLVAVIAQVSCAYPTPGYHHRLRMLLHGSLMGVEWHRAQHVDTGEVLMQAFADRAAICETLQTRHAPLSPACAQHPAIAGGQASSRR